jgi:sortase A
VGIAGHRTSFSAPFRHLDKLKRGDPITVKMPYGRFTYEVAGTGIETPDAVNVLDAGDQLVLTACHPPHSAEKRIVVDARPVSAKPSGPRPTCVGNGCPRT